MAETKPILEHGGNLDAAAARYGIARAQWLDLSTGINPCAYPIGEVDAGLWARLPETGAEAALTDAARAYYGVPAAARVVAAPGTQALIQLLPRLRGPSRVSVIGPTYAEHAHCWRAAGHAVAERGAEAGFDPAADVCVVVQPNNPDGHAIAAEALLAEAGRRAGSGGWLVVDEAFADVMPEVSLAAAAGAPGLIILRSFGKFFGLAGARLGFALGDAETAAMITRALGPWAVAGPSLMIGARALADGDWIAKARARLAADAARLDGIVTAAGHRVVGGTDLFRLVEAATPDLHEGLARQAVWTRAFAGRPGLVRFGLPADAAGFERLAEALAAPAARAAS